MLGDNAPVVYLTINNKMEKIHLLTFVSTMGDISEDKLPKMFVYGYTDIELEEYSYNKPSDQIICMCPITGKKIKEYKASARCLVTVDAIYILKEQLIGSIHLHTQMGTVPKYILNNIWRTRVKLITLLFWLLKNHKQYATDILNNMNTVCKSVRVSHFGNKGNRKQVRWNDLLRIEEGWSIKKYLERIEEHPMIQRN